jgi:coenzyme F420-0:L-glutamate ligase/coenzyme F420-1:gamma-L-glutamate ligase
MILAVALPPLPEVHPGDDLASLIADSWKAAAVADPELGPRPGDVVVVTQKIVSKAEGALVDLTSVEPRPVAVEFATRWDRDPRQVEVVLRESAEILRMQRGIIVSRTRHGFVCANAGVDASNTGTKDVATLLPDDPDASAALLHARLPALLGIAEAEAPAIVISDSFGRPWRFGIVDVALGVAGLAPLDDMRGQPDADGRTMRSTVVAVADEIASAAELAAGKTSRQPVVLVRGVPGVGGTGSIRADVVMPLEMDLFR